MYAITPGCCNDASCVAVCPVDCIHPTPDEPDFGTTSMLYVNPAKCIDCGACADACPVDAVVPADTLTGSHSVWVDVNRDFYRDRPEPDPTRLTFPASLPAHLGRLHIAVVGTGPAAQYTAEQLMRLAGARVTMIDRLPVPGGLLRYGVAPDHPETRLIGDRFTGLLHNPDLRLALNVEVGTDVSVQELGEYFDAVVYAVGAATSRDLRIPGEDLPGSLSATQFVAWYNGHPDADTEPVGLPDARRAVVIGNGNVALDVARILTADRDRLAATDIADRALSALRRSPVREVVVSARRGPDVASYTQGEIHALRHDPDVDLVVADTPGVADAIRTAPAGSHAALLQDVPVVAIDRSAPSDGRARVVLQFGSTPQAIEGADRVRAVRFDTGTVATDLVVRAIGYHGRALPGLPFDESAGTVPHEGGRVSGAPAGTYVVGWIKRGARGGIGANRQDANDTVATLMADAAAGRLPGRRQPTRGFQALLAQRSVDVLDARAARAIDEAERRAGADSGRPRVKFASREELIAAARH